MLEEPSKILPVISVISFVLFSDAFFSVNSVKISEDVHFLRARFPKKFAAVPALLLQLIAAYRTEFLTVLNRIMALEADIIRGVIRFQNRAAGHASC